jgi:HK97 family phage major capsid protein
MRTLKDVRQAYKEATDILPTLTRDAAAFAAKEEEIAALEAELDQFERDARATDIRNRSLAMTGAWGTDEVNDRDAQAAIDDAVISRATSFGEIAAGIGRGQPNGAIMKRFGTLVSQSRRANGMTALDSQKHFRSLGEQLQAVANYALSRGSNTDARLVRAPSGASAVDATGGGFLLQIDYADAIWMLAHELGDIMGAVNSIPISQKSNGLKIPGVDETSRATGSRWGGVQSYWVGEGVTVAPSKPKFRMVEFDLKKLMSLMYTTEEMMADAPALGAIAGQAFSEEVMFMTEDSFINGSGAGLPLGILNSPSLVTIAKQPGQAAGTIVKENIDNMWSRAWARSRRNAVWLINQDCEPQLDQMGQIVGTAGMPVYLPAGGSIAGDRPASLKGRPVIATEYNPALGTPGDILLADLSQYTKIDKGGVETAQSMHVAFLTDESVFRITYRVDGKPMWSTAITPFKGTLTKSPFVALAQR